MNQYNVLLIEDDIFQRSLLQKQLMSLIDCKVQLSGDGEEALSLLNGYEPDIIFCDLNLPNIDGVELVRAIAQKDINSSIVLMSAEASDIISSVKTMSEVYGLKNVHMLQKPMGIKAINGILNDIKNDFTTCNKTTEPHLVFTENDIKLALSSGQLIAYYQPQIDSKSRVVSGAEALLRWHHPEYGILTPNIFIDKIVDRELCENLTHLITRLAIKECKKWHDNGHFISISINVTPSDLMNLAFPDYILSLLGTYNLEPKYLSLEVVESEITQDLAKYLDTLSRLRLKGINTSIDDFGTGSASLIQLITSPFSELKIDMSFVKKMFEDKKYMIAVKATISLAKQLELKVVAEGVEQHRHASFLSALGCDILQGYLFSKPLASDEIDNFLNKHAELNNLLTAAI
ncbi:EAL domain-containing response regulator [Thalassotalea psychrophila]|uniref:EAL domain-containing response regulator n=1 Tax=Thalassotalea psychrophila TaxID=3065647 RepID=A0ABY9TNX5_9GAMM|nr:EAL domain-containing response regulator [Colwelliaceae bacterium SQ149]